MGQGMPKTLGSARHGALVALLIDKRLKAGLTQATLAKKLRRHQSFIATVESWQRRIDVVEFLDLADAIGFDANDALKAVRRAK